MYNELTVSDLNRIGKNDIKEEIKLSIINMGISLGGFNFNFSIDRTKREISEAEIRKKQEQELMLDKIHDERQETLAKIHLFNGFYSG